MKLINWKHVVIIAVTSMTCFTASGQAVVQGEYLPPQSQGPGWVLPKSATDQTEQQRFLTEAYARQQAQQESMIISQQDEILKIYSKDPWRKIHNSINYVGNEGWLQFQGKVQAIETAGLLFQGSVGRVLSISTQTDRDSGLITTQGEVSSESELRRQSARKSTVQSTHVTQTRYEKLYGEDFFLVVNFPYPGQEGKGYERMMAYDAGYITYTNSANRVLTVRKLDYGTPCVKIWSAKEIEAVYARAEAERTRIEAERKSQRDLSNAQAEAERERIEAERKAKLAKILALDREQADAGDQVALHHMGDRYRDGNGVEKDPVKAADYYKKADDVIEVQVNKLNQEQKIKEQAARQRKFEWYVEQSNKGNIIAMIGLGKCYRDGDCVEKDLKKAKEIFQKAAGTYMAGFDNARFDAAKLISTCDQ